MLLLPCARLTVSFFVMVILLPIATPAQAGARDAAFNPADVDSGKIQPLGLRPGCWQIRTHSSTMLKLPENQPAPAASPAPPPAPKPPTEDEAFQKWWAGLTPEQRAHLTPAQIEQYRTIIRAALAPPPVPIPTPAELQKQQAQWLSSVLAKGGGGTGVTCTANPFQAQGKELYGTIPKECTRSVDGSGQQLRGHITCPDRVADYKRIDSEHVSGTVVTTGVSHPDGSPPVPYTTTTTTVAKWIAEASPHLPYAVPMTDLDGQRPKGPFAVARFDPFRVVAVLDGKKFIAQQAYFLINNSSNADAENYGPNLARVMQQIYLHYEIYLEALRLQERLNHPGKYQPGAAVPLPSGMVDPYGRPGCCIVPAGTPIDRDTPDHSSTAFMEHQDGLANESLGTWGWEFYFGQAKTPEEKRSLLHKAEEKYKITVLDPDFFAGHQRD